MISPHGTNEDAAVKQPSARKPNRLETQEDPMEDGRSRSLDRRSLIKSGAALGVGAGLTGRLAPRAFARKAQETVNLQFWDMVWGPPEYIDTAKSLVDRFNQEHPTIQVEYRSVPWNNWYQTFTTAIGSGTAPDVSTGAGYQAAQFYDQGAVAPLDDLVEEMRADGDLEDFLPGTVERLRYDDHYVALPWAIDIRIPFYRKDLFQEAGVEPPNTWEGLASAAASLTTGDRYGMVSMADTGGSHYLYFLILNNGGALFTEDRQVNLMDDRNVEALQFLSGLVQAGSVHPASAGFTGDDAMKAFAQGSAAMILRNPGFPAQFPDLRENIGILEPLTSPHGDKGTVSWVNNIMLYEQTEHPEEARVFLRWWSQNQKPLWTEGHSAQLPARQSIAGDPYFTGDPNLNFIIDNWVPLGKGTGFRAEGIFPALNEVEGEGVMMTLIQDLLQGKDTVESMQGAEERLKSIVG